MTKFKVGEVRKRAILTIEGKQVALFHNGYEALAKKFADFLNELEAEKQPEIKDVEPAKEKKPKKKP
jgi:hypothetical protein